MINDQYMIPLFVAGSLLLTLFAFFLVAYLLVQKNKQNTYAQEKRQMVIDHQFKILQAKIEEQENTMDQLSKEIHDNIKSAIGFVQMNLMTIENYATDDRQKVHINTSQEIIEQVIDNLHNVSHSLSSKFVEKLGLSETLEKELEQIRVLKNISYEIEITGNPFPLQAEAKLQSYRIAQEAIQNCLKHAKATNIHLLLNYSGSMFTMSIKDNGIGFDRNKIFDMEGLGLLNMFQRAKYVQGTLDIDSAPQQGSSITLTINSLKNGNDQVGHS